MSINGSSIISVLVDLLSIDSKMAGSKIKLVNIDINKVNDTNTPKAAVPPKLEAEKIAKPQNKIIEV